MTTTEKNSPFDGFASSTIEKPTDKPAINYWPDEAWDSEGNHFVQDKNGWRFHCRNRNCTEFTRLENFR